MLASIAWLFLSPSDLNSQPPGSTLKIELDELSPPSSRTVRVTGSVKDLHQPMEVKLLIMNVPTAVTQTKLDKEKGVQTFSFDNVQLRIGENEVEVIGHTVVGGRKLQGSSGVRSLSWMPTQPTAAAESFTPDTTPTPCPSPSLNKADEFPASRKMMASLAHRKLDLKFEATLHRDDPRVTSLRRRETSLPQFFLAVFYDFRIQYREINDCFRDVVPEYEYSEKSVTIRASSNPKYPPNVDFGELLIFNPDWRKCDNDKDVFVLNVKDYKVQGFDPPPLNMSQAGAVWAGGQEELPANMPEITVHLSYDPPADADYIVQQLRLSPFEVFPSRYIIPIFDLLQSFLLAIPIIWLLLLLEKFGGASWPDKDFKAGIVGFARMLSNFAFTAPVFYGINVLSSLIYKYSKRMGVTRVDDIRNLLAAALLILLAAYLLMLLSRLIRNKHVALVLGETFRGVGGATIIYLAFITFFGITLKFIPFNVAGLARILTAIVAFSCLLVLLSSLIKLYRSRPDKSVFRFGRWKAVFVITSYILVAAFLSYPAYGLNVLDDPIINVHNKSLESARIFFHLLLNLLPYLFFPCVVWLLLEVEGDSKESRRMFFGLSALVFASYVVGSTPNWFMIPVPFLLALFIFRRYVIQTPIGKCFAVEKVRERAWSDRRGMLERYFSAKGLTQLRQTYEELDKNRLAGEVSDADYQILKSELEGRINECEKDAKITNHVDVRDVVAAIGPFKTNWENAVWAVKRGFILALLFSTLYLWNLLQIETWPPEPYYWLKIVSSSGAFFSYWIVCAFFFGYFFICLRGDSGLQKGVYVSTAVILCLTPIWLISLTSPISLFLRGGQTFLFFTLLGLLSDYQVFRKALGERFGWKKFMQFEEVANFSAFATVMITSIGTTTQSAVTGNFNKVIQDFVNMAFQHLPKIPPLN